MYDSIMSDKKIMILIFSLLTGTAVYQTAFLQSTPVTNNVSLSIAQSSATASISVDDCLDCMEVVPNSCEYQANECTSKQVCSEWMSCVEDCVQLQEDQSCFYDCDLAHSDTYSECNSLKSCMCDVCIGQCVNMCAANE